MLLRPHERRGGGWTPSARRPTVVARKYPRLRRLFFGTSPRTTGRGEELSMCRHRAALLRSLAGWLATTSRSPGPSFLQRPPRPRPSRANRSRSACWSGSTGPSAVAGTDSYKCMQIAADEVNAAGRRARPADQAGGAGRRGQAQGRGGRRQPVERRREGRGGDRRLFEQHGAAGGRGLQREEGGVDHRRHHRQAEDRRPLCLRRCRPRRPGGGPRRLRQGRPPRRQDAEARRAVPEQPDRPGPRYGEPTVYQGLGPTGCTPCSTRPVPATSAPSCKS